MNRHRRDEERIAQSMSAMAQREEEKLNQCGDRYTGQVCAKPAGHEGGHLNAAGTVGWTKTDVSFDL